MVVSRPNNTMIEVDKDARKELRILAAKVGLPMQDLTNAAILNLVRLYEENPEHFTEIMRK